MADYSLIVLTQYASEETGDEGNHFHIVQWLPPATILMPNIATQPTPPTSIAKRLFDRRDCSNKTSLLMGTAQSAEA